MANPKALKVRSATECRWDCASLGEVMLRFDPGVIRTRAARQFQVWEGGGEYNVSRAIRKCFGLRSTVLTALPQNELGLLAEDLIMQGGVDTSHLIWRSFDGIGRNTRMGLNFTERGVGVRTMTSCVDRANAAASQIRATDFDWEHIFGTEGVRWLHTGGVFASLDAGTDEAVLEAVKTAHKYGTIVSYDVNYRPSLWESRGGVDAARELNRKIAPYIDVLVGNIDDFGECLGTQMGDVPSQSDDVTPALYEPAIRNLAAEFPNVKVICTTLLRAQTANFNDWAALVYADGEFFASPINTEVEILDRVGAGDAFAAGCTYAFLSDKGAQAAVEYGVAHGTLAMTTPGDNTMVNLRDVEAFMARTRKKKIW